MLIAMNRMIVALALALAPAVAAPPAARPQAAPPADTFVLPLPPAPPFDAARVALGKRLFHDPQLSQDRSLTCATCHPIDKGGTDHRQVSPSLKGGYTATNTPTIYNVALNFRQFWGGLVETLEEVSDRVIPRTMGLPWDELLARLSQDATYVRDFATAFGGITRDAVNQALADYQRALVPRNAPFDRYLTGDSKALSADAQEGWRLFRDYGCVSCHQGRGVGGNMLQRFGVMGDYFKQRGNVAEADWGHFNATRREKDRFTFKVPSLRNVARSAPYFHDGTAVTLDMAIETMGEFQLGRPLTAAEVKALGAFLESLTGEVPEVARP